MKLKIALSATVLTFLATTAGFADEKNQQVNKINIFEARLWAAMDARDDKNPVFDEALKAGNYDALMYLGQIGGAACQRLIPYFTSPDPQAVAAARQGAMLCADDTLADALMVNSAPVPAINGTDYRYPALGFSGGDGARRDLVAAVNAILPGRPYNVGYPDNARTLPLFGLMQSIVYDRLEADALPGLDFGNLLKLAREMGTGEVAAYLLTRFSGLEKKFDQADVQATIDGADNDIVRMLLIRVLRQYGDVASGALIALASDEHEGVAIEAIRALGRLSDAESLGFLVTATGSDKAVMRHLAIGALAGRNTDDTALTARIAAAVEDKSSWVAVTALGGLMQRDAEQGIALAAAWLAGDDYYRAFSALGLLSSTDEGKAIVKAYADAHPDTNRGREAAIALDPSIEADTKARPAPDYALVQSYQDKELILNTTRGPICITPSPQAPYAAYNFMTLAEAGKMDGMLWHRVIPNFVAQAGQTEDPSINEWGSIREEWFDSDHRIGTVGVATAGRDTGGTQFFINTGYNLHLNNRYTVFGQVVEGLDVAFKLEEGDRILKARVAKAPSGACQ